MKTSISTTHCAIESCPTTILNKSPGVAFHSFPTTIDLRNKWLKVLKDKCSMLDWVKSRICSKHFESRCFDSQRRLKEDAVPTNFATNATIQKSSVTKSRVDRLLDRMTQTELTSNIHNHLRRLRQPSNMDIYVNDNLQCKANTPIEVQLWLMIKKQEHLNKRLQDSVVKGKKDVALLQKKIENNEAAKTKNEQTIESLKYIAKCLQEKHATLEEQIEILTAVESR